jgi:class 3 adenylate cyclase/CHASE2 domain-containing sensor protein
MNARKRIFAWLALLLMAAIVLSVRIAEPFDLALLDRQFAFLRSHTAPHVAREVVIVGIDQQTTEQLREPLALWHAHIGRFVRAMGDAGASVVGLDIVLPDRSYEKLLPGLDRALLFELVAARQRMPVVLGLTADPEGRPRGIFPAFLSAAEASGFVLFPTDRDGLVRRFDEHIAVGGEIAPTLAGQMARALGATVGTGLINYAAGEKIRYVPLQQVLAWQAAGDRDALKAAFGGKPVLLGSVLRFEDRLAVPVNPGAWDAEPANAAGVAVHAQALRNLLDNTLIVSAPAWLWWLLCALAALAGLAVAGTPQAIIVALSGVAALLAASTVMLTRGWHLPPVILIAILLLAVIVRRVGDAAGELREQRQLKKVFSAHVSPQILQQLIASDTQPGLGGQRYRICVLFADIRGFTERSESMTPEAAIALLNDYFNHITASIHDAGGTVDKFLGDGIMAFFGAPQPVDNPCEPAFAAARNMLERLRALNLKLAARGEAPIAIGIGLHVGDAVVGHVGADTRHDYTAIGDTVNVASRLEGLTKDVNFPLVCSVGVFGALGDRSGFAALGERAIKGHRPVDVYGWRPDNVAAAN